MILIIGGAYQGKLDYAKEIYGITDADVYTCGAGDIDFSKQCVYKIEEFAYSHPDPVGYFQTHREEWRSSILILQDIFCGVSYGRGKSDLAAEHRKVGPISK